MGCCGVCAKARKDCMNIRHSIQGSKSSLASKKKGKVACTFFQCIRYDMTSNSHEQCPPYSQAKDAHLLKRQSRTRHPTSRLSRPLPKIPLYARTSRSSQSSLHHVRGQCAAGHRSRNNGHVCVCVCLSKEDNADASASNGGAKASTRHHIACRACHP
jgi:hypothetical protein